MTIKSASRIHFIQSLEIGRLSIRASSENISSIFCSVWTSQCYWESCCVATSTIFQQTLRHREIVESTSCRPSCYFLNFAAWKSKAGSWWIFHFKIKWLFKNSFCLDQQPKRQIRLFWLRFRPPDGRNWLTGTRSRDTLSCKVHVQLINRPNDESFVTEFQQKVPGVKSFPKKWTRASYSNAHKLLNLKNSNCWFKFDTTRNNQSDPFPLLFRLASPTSRWQRLNDT